MHITMCVCACVCVCVCVCMYWMGGKNTYVSTPGFTVPRQAPMTRRPHSALTCSRPVSATLQRLARVGPHHRLHASMLRVHAHPGGPPCAAFVGTSTSKTCPQSYSQVRTEAACQSLAAIGGKSYPGSVNVATLPPGCFWLTVGGGVYLNTHATGAAHANAQQLCAGAPTRPRRRCMRSGAPPMRRRIDILVHTRTRPATARVGARALRRCSF
jgi:hypothetical protein